MAEMVERVVKKYYKTLEEGIVLGRKCVDCGNVEWPPVYACNACGCLDTEWVEMSQKGEILSILMPTVMSTRASYVGLEPFAYGVVRAEEGPERNVMILNVTKKNVGYIREHLPYPAHMVILERDGYHTAVFAIDPIDEFGNPLEEEHSAVVKKAEIKTDAKTENAAATNADEDNYDALDPEVFAQLAEIVADAYKVDAAKIQPDTKFEGEFKGSSVLFVGIVANIENEMDVFISITDASTCKTVGALALRIQEEM